MNPRIGQILRTVFPPLAVLVMLVVVWSLLIRCFSIKEYFLPSPLMVLSAAIRISAELSKATWLTAQAALGGFCLSIVIGSLVAIVFSQSSWMRRGCFPYAVLLQTVPIVAIAPLILFWFHAGIHSVILIAFIVSVFPIIANLTAGLTSVDRGLVELFQLNGAGRLQMVFKLQIPHAIPDLVTGARTSAGLSVIGAIVGEFFAGNSVQQHGLGFMVPQRIYRLQTDEAFAAVATAALLGMTMFGSVSLMRSTLLSKWCNAR